METIVSNIAGHAILCAVFLTGCTPDLHPAPSNTDLSEKAAVEILKPIAESIAWNSNGRVYTLDLCGDSIQDKHLAYVRHLSELQFLNLWGSNITDDGLLELREMTELSALGLRLTRVSDEGLKNLQSQPKLSTLDVSNTSISDAGLLHLQSIRSLKRVFLAKTRVTQEGVDSLQNALPDCKIQSQ